MHIALTIAGSDSGGGAGIQADLKTFAAFGVYGLSAITAVTAQNTARVLDVFAVPPELVSSQIDAVASDIAIHAVKTGMLANSAIISTIAGALRRWHLPHVVVDPVMVAKSGDSLIEEDAVACLTRELLPLAEVVTPNRAEAEVLAKRSIDDLEDARMAAQKIHGLGPSAVIIKGGHFQGDPLTNLLFDGSRFHEFTTRRLTSRHTHGTGCTFASAIAALLARGVQLPDATQQATEYLAGAVAHGLPLGRGHGPLDHFWRGAPRSDDRA
jgi:hydroxymethylpyrimidine/phosphomethylpyrimidine kinase